MPSSKGSKALLTPKSVFITGANGFIGRRLMERYTAAGAQVRGMDLMADPDRNVVAGNLTQPRSWAHHANGCELFINAAAVVSFAADWQTYRDVSMQGVRHALNVAIAAKSRRFVHFSSIAALGYDYPDGADETSPTVIGERMRYGVAKAGSEHTVLAAHAAGEIDCTIIRPGDVYGPGSRAWLIEPLKMARAGQLILPNHGKGLFTPVYIDDLLDGTMLAAGSPEAVGQIYILTSGVAVSCHDFFTNHCQWVGRSGGPRSLPLGLALRLATSLAAINRLLRRPNEVTPDTMLWFSRKGNYSIEKAKNELGYAPAVSLEEGMKRSWQWLRDQGEL